MSTNLDKIIYNLDSKGERLITIMSSLAQEESRSISENVTRGQRKRFADVKVSLADSSFLGYRKGEDGQMEMERRKNMRRNHNCCGMFSAKLKCGDRGEFFGSKVWHSNSKYRRTIWQCNAKFKGGSKCTTLHLYEQRIQELFLESLGKLMENREVILDDCCTVMNVIRIATLLKKRWNRSLVRWKWLSG